MAIKKGPGRPTKKEAEKVKVGSVYLTGKEHSKIVKKYKSLTNSIREEVLPRCITD